MRGREQAGNRQVPVQRGEPPLCPPLTPESCWAMAGGPQQPLALTGGKTDGRGCVLSCTSHIWPPAGRDRLGGGHPVPTPSRTAPGLFWRGMATCGVLVACGVWNMAEHRQGRNSRQEICVGWGTAHVCAHECVCGGVQLHTSVHPSMHGRVHSVCRGIYVSVGLCASVCAVARGCGCVPVGAT